jgi:hypothetical protein
VIATTGSSSLTVHSICIMTNSNSNNNSNDNTNDDENENENENPSPSHSRRQKLKAADAGNVQSFKVLPSYPLVKYFDIAQRLLDSFQLAVDDRDLDVAYVYGVRFANLAIESLPRHPEWRDGKAHLLHKKRKVAQQVETVLNAMETIVQRMDVEELVKLHEHEKLLEEQQKERKERFLQGRAVEAKQLQALEDQRNEYYDQHERNRRKEETNTTTTTTTTGACDSVKTTPSTSHNTGLGTNEKQDVSAIEKSAMAKLWALQSQSQSKPEPLSYSYSDSGTGLQDVPTRVASEYKTTTTTKKNSSRPQQQQQQRSNSITVKPVPSQKGRSQGTGTTKPVATIPGTKATTSEVIPADVKKNHHTQLRQQEKEAQSMSKSSSSSSSSRTPLDSTRSLDGNEQETAKTKTQTGEEKAITNHDNRPSKRSIVGSKASALSSSMNIRMFASSDGGIETVDIATTQILPPTTISSSCTCTPSKTINPIDPSSCNNNGGGGGGGGRNRGPNHHKHKYDNPIIRSPLYYKEQKTIDLLQRTITLQEQRLVDIETIHIPELLHQARDYLGKNNHTTTTPSMSTSRKEGGNKKKALECVAKKRALERQIEVIKAAIFTMETQMFMLENTMEDRHVQKALAEAADVLKNIRVEVNGNADSVNGYDLLEVGSMALPLMDQLDDDELMEELHDWLSPPSAKSTTTPTKRMGPTVPLRNDDGRDDLSSVLSLPTVPQSGKNAQSVNKSTNDVINPLMG